MTASQHTPGPWHVKASAGCRLNIESGSRLIASTLEYVPANGEAEANARLIAAAPEMLSVLRKLDGCGFYNDEIRAAIAKAEGQS